MGDRFPEAPGERFLRGVVQVMLAAEEQHLVLEQRGSNSVEALLIECRRKRHAGNFGADAARHLADSHR